jgi:transcriptional regulator with XRE-family HTH domain
VLMPAHARMARAALKWSFIELSEKTGVSKNTLVRFEAGQGIHHSTAIKIEAAYAKAGVTFVYEDETKGPGIQLTKELSGRLGETSATHTKAKSGKRSQKAK